MSSSMDVDMPDAAATAEPLTDEQQHDDDDVDMGYEDCAPQVRRGSMTLAQERDRRASIKAVMADKNLSPKAKRLSIQHLMDGRRNSVSSGIDGASVHTTVTTSSVGSHASPPANPMTTFVCLPCTNTTMDTAIVNDQTMRAEHARPPCTHYERWCTMIAPCCGGAFGCRICHDECPDLYVVARNLLFQSILTTSYSMLFVTGRRSSITAPVVIRGVHRYRVVLRLKWMVTIITRSIDLL